jgi:hypothetical protein
MGWQAKKIELISQLRRSIFTAGVAAVFQSKSLHLKFFL